MKTTIWTCNLAVYHASKGKAQLESMNRLSHALAPAKPRASRPPLLHLLKCELQRNYLCCELMLAHWLKRHIRPLIYRAILVGYIVFCVAILTLIAIQIHRTFPGN